MKKQIIASILTASLLGSVPYAVLAKPQTWINVNVHDDQEAEKSLFNSEHYDFVKYSQIRSKLEDWAKQSNRVTFEVNGKSSDGRDMYVVTIADPSENGKFGKHQALRKQMFKNPEKAQDWVDKNKDFKVPIMINGSIHGTEFVGSDAVLQLIERFAFENDETTKEILSNNILIFNVVANPDGRVKATRFNGNGIDLNRDFITQSQPETKQTVDLITKWNPMVFLDLHGYVNWFDKKPGLIEPCTPPHNPNYEYDLFSKWATSQAEAMESEIVKNRDLYTSDLYKTMEGTYIPQRDDSEGWDDYPPIFTPMYAMYHGAYGYTLEAPTNDWDGVRWTYDAVMGALTFATENKKEMLKDQIEVFKRGINFDHPYHNEGFFPEAYVLPINPIDPTVTQKAVQHLLNNDIEVEEAKKSFTLDGKSYPAGTFIVKMDQAKAGLANTMLWDGEDITNSVSTMYDIAAWSLPELWGFEAISTHNKLNVTSSKVNQIHTEGALVGKGPYLIPNTSVQSVHLVNQLLQSGVSVSKDSQGNFYVEGQKGNILKNLTKDSGLTLQTAKVPNETKQLKSVKVAILKDGGINKQQSHAGTKLALQRLGFDVTELHPREVATAGLHGFDVFVYSGSANLLSTNQTSTANKEFWLENSTQLESFKNNINQFLENGGKYIAVGSSASQATKNTLRLTDVNVHVGGSNSNGIVKVNYSDSALTKGYKAEDIGFVYRPAWYSNTGSATVLASFANDPDFFIAGHWSNRERAQGQPVIIKEKNKDVTLIGLEAGFRDHTDYLFRLLSNTIFDK